MSFAERFDELANRRVFGRQEPPPEPRRATPEEEESQKLESWAQDKDTRVVYSGRLDRLISEGEASVRLNIGDSEQLRYLLGRVDALRDERAWILKTAGLANGRPPQGD